MHKNFAENNQLRKELIDKFYKAEKREFKSENEKIEYLQFILFSEGFTFYIAQTFDMQLFFENIKDYFDQKNKIEFDLVDFGGIKVFHLKGGQKLAKFIGLVKPVSLVIGKKGNALAYSFIPSEWFDNPVVDQNSFKQSAISQLFVDNIETYILEYIQSTIDKELLIFATNENYFVENFNPRFQQFFLSERQDKEILLAWLNVASIINLGLNKDNYTKLSWFYFLSNYESLLLGFNKHGDLLEAFDFQDRKMVLTKKLRKSIVIDKYEWFPTMSNVSKYKIISQASTMSAEQRVNYFAKMNFLNSKDSKYSKFLVAETGFITSNLTLFFLDYLKNPSQTIIDYSKDEKISKILTEIIAQPQSEEALVFWFNDWEPNIEQSVFIMKMFVELAKDIQDLKKLLPLHKVIHEFLIKKEKDSYNKMLYDIEYTRHLIVLENFKEAEQILKKDLKKLPDLNLTELLPAENVDPTGNLSGQFLKVVILELLSQTQKEKNSIDFIRKAAVLQPLSQERIYKLTAVKDEHLNSKARTVLEIITGNDLKPISEFVDKKYKQISKDLIEKIKHPIYQKKGTFSKFSKWISSYKTPDFATLKDVAEKFSPVKHKEVADIIADILQVFNIPNLEIYIAKGKQSIGITAYEAQTPFLIIGGEHFNPNSPHYFTYNEMNFAIAHEIAFLFFKFARITSTDIWRGTMEKGNFVVETLIDLIPFAGSVSGVLKKATKLRRVSDFMEKNNKISLILQKGQQIETIANKSKGVLNIASDMLSSLKNVKPNKENQKREEIIAISRMMQITADRVGLLFCDDPVSAVRSVFLSSKNLVSQIPTIQKYGLNSFLLKKDENENYVNLNFAIRFASMFSFWLSDDFENIKSLMQEK